MDRIDEAVEVALAAYVSSRGSYEGEVPASPDDIRAAILVALPVLLGEPVGWQRRIRGDSGKWSGWTDWEDLYGAGMAPKIGRWDAEYRPVYAPSLGEGDGR